MVSKMKYIRLLTLLVLTNHVLCGQNIFESKISLNCRLTVVKNDSLNVINISSNTSNNLKTLLTDETAYFENPVFFKFDNSNFLRVQEVTYGTAYSNIEHLYHISKDCRLDSIQFDEASKQYSKKLDKDEIILKGEYRTFKDNEITFSFGIWKKEDPNCCPSKGYIKGKYKLIKTDKEEKVKYKMTVSEQSWTSEL